jgi:hypothetical protein
VNGNLQPALSAVPEDYRMKRTGLRLVIGLVAILPLAGCAFDVVHVRQVPVAFSSGGSEAPTFLLGSQVNVHLGTGFPTLLRKGTTWSYVGETEFGKVYSTKDQIVKVEASNIYEAYIVVSNRCLTGFYLPVEKTFSPLSRPLPLELKDNP